MSIGRFIADRLEFKSRLALVSTFLSAFVIVLSISILQGFKRELYSSISSLCSEIRLQDGQGRMNTAAQEWKGLDRDKRIASVYPAVYQSSIIKKNGVLQGVLFRNSDKLTSPLGVIIPMSLAKKLDVSQGDTLLSYFIADKVKARNFIVQDIIPDPALLDRNSVVVYASTSDLQRLKGYSADEADCLEIRLTPQNQGRRAIDDITAELAYKTGLQALSSTKSYPAIYDWLQILDTNVLVIMTLMCIVAGFNMISAFLITVIRNTSTIGTLKTLGMTGRQISRAFVLSAARTSLKGLFIGDAAALLFCLVQSHTHLLKLDAENYFVSYVPIYADIPLIVLANAAALVIIMAFVSIPTGKISRIDPAQSTKGETL